jgi:hypothetical protein
VSVWEINKSILIKQYPGLLEEITKESGISDNIKIEIPASGEPSLNINGIYIHSPREPVRESRRLAEAVKDGTGPIIILGFGLGYAAQAAAEFGRPLIIVEKNMSLVAKAMELRDFSGFLSRKNIVFISGGSVDGITSALSLFSEKTQDQAASSVIRNRALIELDKEWYSAAEDRIRTWTMRDEVNTATFRRFGKRWVRNLSRNMSAIRDYPGISRLTGIAQETSMQDVSGGDALPVFLAAAGPSLDLTGSFLHEIRRRCIIVAVDTSMCFFIKNGIEPDFLLVVDPQFWNSRHLDCLRRVHTPPFRANKKGMNSETNTTPKQHTPSLQGGVVDCLQRMNSKAASKNNILGTRLIAESAVYPPVLRLPFSGTYLCGSLFPLGNFIEKQVDPKGRLGAGGSVATTAWDFARMLGSSEIWIAGLDLAFPGLKTHFRGALFEDRCHTGSYRFNPAETWLIRALRNGIPFKAPSSNEEQKNLEADCKVLTDRRLSLYAAWFENRFKQYNKVRNYNLFPGGLAIDGFINAEPNDLLALPDRRDEINRRLTKAFSQIESDFFDEKEKSNRTERYEKAVSALISGLKNIRVTAIKGAGVAGKALKRGLSSSQQNKVLKDLDEITSSITNSEVKEVAGFLFPYVEKEAADDDPLRAYLKSSQKLFSSLAEAAGFTLSYVMKSDVL